MRKRIKHRGKDFYWFPTRQSLVGDQKSFPWVSEIFPSCPLTGVRSFISSTAKNRNWLIFLVRKWILQMFIIYYCMLHSVLCVTESLRHFYNAYVHVGTLTAFSCRSIYDFDSTIEWLFIYLYINIYIYMIFASSNTVLLSNRLFSSDISKTKGVPCHWSYDGYHMQSVCIDRKACEFLFHPLQSIIDRTVCDNVCQTCGKLVVLARYLLCQYNW